MCSPSKVVTLSTGSEAARCLHHAITNAPHPPQPGASGGQFQPLQSDVADAAHYGEKALQGSFIHSMGFDPNLVLRALDLFGNNEQQAIDALLDGRVPQHVRESDARRSVHPAQQQQQQQEPKLTHDRVLGHIIVAVPLAPSAPAASASAAAPMYISPCSHRSRVA